MIDPTELARHNRIDEDIREVRATHDFDCGDAPYQPEVLTVARAAERLADEVERLRALLGTETGGNGAVSPSFTEWCAWWGGDDPNDCAGLMTYDTEDEARSMLQYMDTPAGGGVARRPVLHGPWQVSE